MIQIWDIPEETCIKTLRGHKGWVSSVAFSANGKHLASAGIDNTIRLWNTHNWLCAKELVGDTTFESAAFSPGGSMLASSSENVIQM